jgi:hypothetical protein
MLVHKQELIEWLVEHDDEGKAFELDGSDFPEEVDTEKDRALLDAHGIDVDSLTGRPDS